MPRSSRVGDGKMGYGPGGIFSFSLAATIKHRSGVRFHICCVLSLALAGAGCGGTVLETKQLADISRSNFDGAYISYFLPRGELAVTVSYEKKTLSLAYTDPKIVPDFSSHYHVVYNHAPLSSDSITVETTSNGLLKKVSSTTEDQTVALVKNVNAVLTQVQALEKAVEADKKISSLGPPSTPGCADDLKFATTVTIDLTHRRPQQVGRRTGTCEVELSINVDVVDSLQARGFPKADEISGPQTCTDVVCFRIAGVHRVHIDAKFYSKDKENKKILISQLQVPDIDVLAPMAEHLGFVRFNRRSFVQNATTATFSDGMLTSFSATDPSELVGFLTLPTEVLKTTTLLIQL